MRGHLWGRSRHERLEAARSLSAGETEAIQAELCRNCPVEPWPYGIPTTINPLVTVLGASPGNSPAPGDVEYLTGGAQQLPPAGLPHPGTYYQDTGSYWDKARLLATTMLAGDGLDDHDALALFGNLNLDTGASGKAKNVSADLRFVRWLLINIRDNLRPQFLLCLGLTTYFRDNPNVVRLFETTFDGFRHSKPQTEWVFNAYSKKRYKFREWDVTGPLGNGIKIVLWPQHPSWSPMTNFEMWRASCEEFKERHHNIII